MEQPFQNDSGAQEVQEVSQQANGKIEPVNVASKNWKAGLAFGKVAPMPAKGWKTATKLIAFQQPEKKLASKKIRIIESEEPIEKPRKAFNSTLNQSTKPIKKTPLSKVGSRHKQRMNEMGSEVDVFLWVWENKKHICNNCSGEVKKAFIGSKLIKPQCFPHILPKGLFPQFRVLKENIGLVCSIDCHTAFDKKHGSLENRRQLELEFNNLLQLGCQ